MTSPFAGRAGLSGAARPIGTLIATASIALRILGIAILNILRITVVAVVAYVFGQLPAVIVHDYGSVIATVAFLMAFWAFAYNVVLERIGGDGEDQSPEQGSNATVSVATVPS